MEPRQKPGRSKQDYGTPPEFLAAAKLFKGAYRAESARTERDALPPGETGRELSAGEATVALSGIVRDLKARGLPTHGF